MAAQKRSSKNYIDLVDEGGEERRLVVLRPASVHPIREYLLGLVAAVLPPRGEAR
jgi:hypothetical protein